MKKKPRFFCDNCGYEVGSDVKTCPFCGRFFASVRCPRCDYSGPDKLFQNGCPLCGYSASIPPPAKSPAKNVRVKRPRHAESMPPWVIIVSFLVLFIVLALFSYLITR